MNSAVLQRRVRDAAPASADRLTGVVLARIASAAASESQIVRDVAGILGPGGGGEPLRARLAQVCTVLQASGQVERQGDIFAVTDRGRAAALEFLEVRKGTLEGWVAVRDGAMVAKALGSEGAAASRLKSLGKIDGLRAAIVETHWQLKTRGKPSASRIRAALALVALERAFGNQIKSELGIRSTLSAKASRLLAGQLARKPRDFGTDGRLVAALAAEAVGATRSELGQLRAGLLRGWLAEVPAASVVRAPERAPPAAAVDAADRAAPAHAVALPSVDPVAARPDPKGFAAAVKAAARLRAEGWSGNRRAFVSHVWALIQESHAAWRLSEIEFKCMLAEAHRAGLVTLANADLKDKRTLQDVQASAVTYKNTVWHYIRVED